MVNKIAIVFSLAIGLMQLATNHLSVIFFHLSNCKDPVKFTKEKIYNYDVASLDYIQYVQFQDLKVFPEITPV